ncbi:unnamed protein product [Effrenium voratum]|uniref:PPPDE domain-containing protein n=1 Tax=Effrenium voratum TaxID=2562239 RepID=A0AA36MQE8_9DINO|nr:unnamed protein product [Effrenium voratum]
MPFGGPRLLPGHQPAAAVAIAAFRAPRGAGGPRSRTSDLVTYRHSEYSGGSAAECGVCPGRFAIGLARERAHRAWPPRYEADTNDAPDAMDVLAALPPGTLEALAGRSVPDPPRPGTLHFTKPEPAPPAPPRSTSRPGQVAPGERVVFPGLLIAQTEDGARQIHASEPSFGIFDLERERYFKAWSATAKKTRLWKRQKREENCRRWLGKKARAQAFWQLLQGLGTLESFRPVTDPARLVRGDRVRVGRREAQFLSCTDKGVCKVIFDEAAEAQIVATRDVYKIEYLPHPYTAALAFLVWSQWAQTELQLAVARLRSELAYHRAIGKIGRALLAMTTFTDRMLGVKLSLRRWRGFVAAKELEKSRRLQLRQAFRAWFEILVMVKHNNALDQLDQTYAELQETRSQYLKAGMRSEKMKVIMDQLFLMDLDLWGSWVLSAWRWAVRLGRASDDFALQARLKRAEQALKLTDAMAKVSIDFAKPHFHAWITMVRHDRRRKILAARWIYGVGSDTLGKVFNAWRDLKYSEFEAVSRQLQRKEQEFRELHALSSQLYLFSQQATGRVQRMESALGAADRALATSAQRGEELQREALELQQRLLQQQQSSALQRQQYEFQMNRRSEAEFAAQEAQNLRLQAELRASEDQQVHLHQQMGDFRAESEELLRRQLEQCLAEAEELQRAERAEALCGRSAEEGAAFHAEEAAAARLRAAESEAEAQRWRQRGEAAAQRARTLQQELPHHLQDEAATLPRPEARAVPTETVQPPAASAEIPREERRNEAEEEEEEDEEEGYTMEEWMEFFEEEGLSSEYLEAMEKIFKRLNLAGHVPVEVLNRCLEDPAVELRRSVRRGLLDFLHDVEEEVEWQTGRSPSVLLEEDGGKGDPPWRTCQLEIGFPVWKSVSVRSVYFFIVHYNSILSTNVKTIGDGFCSIALRIPEGASVSRVLYINQNQFGPNIVKQAIEGYTDACRVTFLSAALRGTAADILVLGVREIYQYGWAADPMLEKVLLIGDAPAAEINFQLLRELQERRAREERDRLKQIAAEEERRVCERQEAEEARQAAQREAEHLQQVVDAMEDPVDVEEAKRAVQYWTCDGIYLSARHLFAMAAGPSEWQTLVPACLLKDGGATAECQTLLPMKLAEQEAERVEQGEAVWLHVYDLTDNFHVPVLNSALRTAHCGLFHAGVEVFGREFSFGAGRSSGVYSCAPKGHTGHPYRESLLLGFTTMSKQEVKQLLREMKQEWRGSSYRLLSRNCVHFCSALGLRLGVVEVPSWVFGMADRAQQLVSDIAASAAAVGRLATFDCCQLLDEPGMQVSQEQPRTEPIAPRAALPATARFEQTDCHLREAPRKLPISNCAMAPNVQLEFARMFRRL